MNYIELNGVRSDTVDGLIIQELPPVTKPLMRTEIEEIDGRDGDLITELGYAAYDRTAKIGLHGRYRIDDAIAFFSSSGVAVFSNEPDRFYKYTILEQIDFQRLVRFREAEVVFHVQPFKYSAVSNKLNFDRSIFELFDTVQIKNGVRVSVNDNVVTVKGTATQASGFFLKMKNPAVVTPDQWKMRLKTKGDGTGASARIIVDFPLDSESFGGRSLDLRNNSNSNMTKNVAEESTYNYFYLLIPSGKSYNFSTEPSLYTNLTNNFVITNFGNTISKPKITVYGTGTIKLGINGKELITLTMGDYDHIVLDVINYNAYSGNVLCNRSVSCDYDDIFLQQGDNIISFTGEAEKIVFEEYSRWL